MVGRRLIVRMALGRKVLAVRAEHNSPGSSQSGAGQALEFSVVAHAADDNDSFAVAEGIALQAKVECDSSKGIWRTFGPRFDRSQVHQAHARDGLIAKLVTQLVRRIQRDGLLDFFNALETLAQLTTLAKCTRLD